MHDGFTFLNHTALRNTRCRHDRQEAIVKVYVNLYDEGTVTCPHCEKSKRLSFTKQKTSREPLRVKCACGSPFKIIVELRN